MNPKGFSNIVFIIILVIIFAGAAGYFVFVKKPTTQSPPQSSNNVMKWKEYTNLSHKYSFSYPADWYEANPTDFLQMTDYYPPAWYVVSSPNIKRDSSGKIIRGSFAFVQTFDTTATLDDLEKQVKLSKNGPTILTIERTKLNSGVEALKEVAGSKTQGTMSISYTLINQKTGLIMSCNYLSTDNSGATVCEKMTSTLQISK